MSASTTTATPTANTTAAATVYPKAKKGRGRPKPALQPVLNREALLLALDAADITVTKAHIDAFYQAMHREHYPPLDEFVDRYYKNDRDAIQSNLNSSSSNNKNSKDKNSEDQASNNPAAAMANPQEDPSPTIIRIPLKNAVTTRKNRNRMNLPRPFLQFLANPNNGFVTVTSKVSLVKTSGDGSTTKLAVQLYDGQLVETVLMRYGPKTADNVVQKCGRASLCVSSQVGCAMACNFCATGMMGLTGSLHYSEILEQVVHAERILAQEAVKRITQEQLNPSPVEVDEQEGETSLLKKNNRKKHGVASDLEVVRNVVFMGMGEPLDNYTNVVTACRALIDRKRWNLAHGRVTVSTVGIASKIRQLTQDLPEICLALSLHAPNQRLRSVIVPTAKHYPIEDMIDALDGHMRAAVRPRKDDVNTHHRSATPGKKNSTKRRAMIEYVMLEGETSTLECAHELGKLCEGRSLVVNLIPYNQTGVKDKLRCPSEDHIREFQHIVSSYGTFCTVRRTMGADIDSACGQLITLENEKKDEEGVVRDIEDGLIIGRSNGNPSSKKGVVKKPSLQSTSKSTCSTNVTTGDGATADNAVDLDAWIRPLQIATTVAATAFLVTGMLFLGQRKKR